jgi:hypothetical protein
MNFKIINAAVYPIIDQREDGWIEILVDGEYKLEFYTSEHVWSPGIFEELEFEDDRSSMIAKKIGLELTDDFRDEMFAAWDKYSNENFR